MSAATSRVLYLPHGGGPLPLLGDPGHAGLVEFLSGIAGELGQPAAIVLISAHWEAAVPTLTAAASPALVFDYYGFPPPAYSVRYPAPGDPALAGEVHALLAGAGIEAALDATRGFDHGMFVPLKLIYPEARIPCVQLSLRADLDPAAHIALGQALAPLRERNVLIVGSGMSFHNMRALLAPDADSHARSVEFDNWLVQTCCDASLTPPTRAQRLCDWAQAPSARFCHPREEHLLPLQVCYGAAAPATPAARLAFNRDLLGNRVSALLW